MTKPTDSIFIVAPSQYRVFMLKLAERLKAREGSRIHLYCSTPQEVNHYRTRSPSDLFDSIQHGGMLYEGLAEDPPPETEVVARAQEHESWLGQTYNELALSDRHFGRGFALAGFYHPRSHYSKAGYRRILHAYNKGIDFWRHEIAEKKPRLVLWGNRLLVAVAVAEGVPVRLLAGSRYRDFHYWSVNTFWENPEVERIYQNLPADADFPIEIETPYHSHVVNRQRFMTDSGLANQVVKMALATARYTYWRLRGYEKAKSYFLSEDLAFHVRVWRQNRALRHAGLVPLKALEGQRFVFFPLQTEPETSLHALSPEYFFQLAAIASIARDLPAGVRLAVKETFAAVGRRPDNFYDQIGEFKNVVQLEMLELGLDVVRQAEAVITINGTAGLEAAVRGKPVITFGRHNLYAVMPHVLEVCEHGDLKRHLEAALGGMIDPEPARRDARRYLKAVIDSSFDMRGYDPFNPDTVEDAAVEDAYDSLIAGIGWATPPEVSAPSLAEEQPH